MIIVSITGPTMKAALAQMSSSVKYADLFEFRLDMIRHFSIPVLLVASSKPTIFTCRPVWEGGHFCGSERKRIQILEAASLLGATYVDIELKVGKRVLSRFIGRRNGAKTIVSVHKFNSGAFSVNRIYQSLSATGANVIKFAFQAGDASDNAKAFEFLTLAKRDRQKAVAIAMGEAGEASRVLYRKFGGWATYAAAEGGDAAASGQIAAKQLKGTYRADVISRSTKVYGVIGNPLGQSKGVVLHNPLFHRAKENAVYCRFPAKKLGRFMSSVAPILSGFSVTIPHKQEIGKYLYEIDATARAIGAVNTVLQKNGKLCGTNTDARGALDAIERMAHVKGKRLLVLGAGGAARAIIHEARRRGAHVLVTNRTALNSWRLASEFKIEFVRMEDLVGLKFDILANATSVGMTPNISKSPVSKSLLKNKIVFDAVYNPPMTKLLRDALSNGAKIVQGTEMYINQAALQSELYCGMKPDRKLMKKLLGL